MVINIGLIYGIFIITFLYSVKELGHIKMIRSQEQNKPLTEKKTGWHFCHNWRHEKQDNFVSKSSAVHQGRS